MATRTSLQSRRHPSPRPARRPAPLPVLLPVTAEDTLPWVSQRVPGQPWVLFEHGTVVVVFDRDDLEEVANVAIATISDLAGVSLPIESEGCDAWVAGPHVVHGTRAAVYTRVLNAADRRLAGQVAIANVRADRAGVNVVHVEA